jgi:hypothetical protein
MVHFQPAQLAVDLKGNAPSFHVERGHQVQVGARLIQSHPARLRQDTKRTQGQIACLHLQVSHITRRPARDAQTWGCALGIAPAQFHGHALPSEAGFDRRVFGENAAAGDRQAGPPPGRGHRHAPHPSGRDLGQTQGCGGAHFDDQVAQQGRLRTLGCASEAGLRRAEIDPQSARQNHRPMHARPLYGKRNRCFAQSTPSARRKGRGRGRRPAEEIVGGSDAQVFDIKTFRRHLGRFPESMPRSAQSHDDTFRTHHRLRVERGLPEDLHATRDQGAQPAYPQAVDPHVPPSGQFQAQPKPRHHALVPQPDADGHHDQGRQDGGPQKNEAAGC